jgi:hypothetical protein
VWPFLLAAGALVTVLFDPPVDRLFLLFLLFALLARRTSCVSFASLATSEGRSFALLLPPFVSLALFVVVGPICPAVFYCCAAPLLSCTGKLLSSEAPVATGHTLKTNKA